MENNKAYLKKLPLVFLIILASVCLQVFSQPDIRHMSAEKPSFWVLFLNYTQFSAVALLALGYALNKWKAALIGIGSTIAVSFLDLYFFTQHIDSRSDQTQTLMFVGGILLSALPYLVFFLAQKIPLKKLPALILIILVTRSFGNIYSVQPAYEFLNKIFHTEILSDRTGNLIVFLAYQVFLILFYCEVQNYVDGKAEDKNTTLLNPRNEYDKLSGVIAFWAVKTFVYAIIIGSVNQLQSLRYFFSFWESGNVPVFYYSSIIQTFLSVLTILFCGWYLRKFMLEYLVTYNITSRFVYWLLLIPVIGFIVWLFLLTAEKSKTFQERINAIHSFSASESSGVTVIVIIGMILQLVYVLSISRETGPLLFLLADAGIFVWMISNKQGYQITLWLRIIAFATVICFLFLHQTKRDTILYASVIYPFLLLSIFQLVLIFPVYHFDTFGYISDGAEVPPADVSGDQLAEFDLSAAK